ncbi:MAG: UbiA family prenyltransferase [Jatrophihabitantaceae bacterium]
MSTTATTSALVRSCHPGPTVAVTCFATVLAVCAGNDAATCTVLAVAVLAGQLSIGWSNDRIDATRDRIVDRTDKPIATGELAGRTVDRVIAAALLVTVAFSLALGWRAGLLHLAAVGCGWSYNLWLKATWFSFVPYAAAFGALPAIATLALPDHPAPAAWLMIAGALFGIAAHLANALPDLAGDRATGVLGLPHRIGARPSLVLIVMLLIAATGWLALGPPGAVIPLGWAALAFSAVAGIGGAATLWQRPTSKLSFYAIIAIVGLDLVLIVLSRHQLH